jgi:hypothetical protein
MKIDCADFVSLSTPRIGRLGTTKAEHKSGSPEKLEIGAFSVSDFRY